MSAKTYWLVAGLLIGAALILRLIPIVGNNFYFTMDQGRDAVYVRQLIAGHKLLWQGPVTSIPEVYNGPFWYYFLAIGFFLLGGHPAGGVLMVVFLNIALMFLLAVWLKKRISPAAALAVILGLLVSWWFYDSSRYAFNPFPTVFLAFWLTISLLEFLGGRRQYIVWAAIPVALTLHTEVVAIVPFMLLYLAVFVWGTIKKQIKTESVLAIVLIFVVFSLPHFISEILTGFSQLHALQKYLSEPTAVTKTMNFANMGLVFVKILGTAIVPQNSTLGLMLFLGLFGYSLLKKLNRIVIRFSWLTILLLVFSFLWFGSNTGWHAWQTVYLPPLLLAAFILLATQGRYIGYGLLAIVMVFQTSYFYSLYLHFVKPLVDPSLLVNELQAIDWVYKEANSEGFYSYQYLPSVYDYPYQYLIWWQGLHKYGYLPCEYSTFINTPSMFVPDYEEYQQPVKTCDKQIFLIIEPNTEEGLRTSWINEISNQAKLIKEDSIGSITVQKRERL
jgi:hypothetical protein